MENIAIINQNMNNTRAIVEELVKKWNEYHGDKDHLDDMPELERKINTRVSEYNTLAQKCAFEEAKASDDPMIHACTVLSYGVIGVKDEKVENTDIVVRKVVDKVQPIDLLALDKYCSGIGKDHEWLIKVESFNYRLALRVAEDINAKNMAELKATYAVSAIAKEYDLGKNPVSNKTMLATVRAMVTAMIGEEYAPKVLSHDVNYLVLTYSGKDRKSQNTVKLADHRAFRNLMAEICHNLITGCGYAVAFKARRG